MLKFLYIKLILFLYILVILLPIKPALAVDYVKYKKAEVRVLNKATGKVRVVMANINDIVNADKQLSFMVKVCFKTTQKYDPEDVMFIYAVKAPAINKDSLKNNTEILNNISNSQNNASAIANNTDAADNFDKVSRELAEANASEMNASKLIFSGWMFSTAPEVSW